jgi:hypothetical protein
MTSVVPTICTIRQPSTTPRNAAVRCHLRWWSELPSGRTSPPPPRGRRWECTKGHPLPRRALRRTRPRSSYPRRSPRSANPSCDRTSSPLRAERPRLSAQQPAPPAAREEPCLISRERRVRLGAVPDRRVTQGLEARGARRTRNFTFTSGVRPGGETPTKRERHAWQASLKLRFKAHKPTECPQRGRTVSIRSSADTIRQRYGYLAPTLSTRVLRRDGHRERQCRD